MKFKNREQMEMGQYKSYYMELEEEYGDTVEKVVHIINQHPELVQTKILVKSLNDDLPKLHVGDPVKTKVHEAFCKDILLQEICDILINPLPVDRPYIKNTYLRSINFPHLLRFMCQNNQTTIGWLDSWYQDAKEDSRDYYD